MNPVQKPPLPPPSVPRRVRLSVAASTAKEVVVTGDFTAWAKEGVRLTRSPGGGWETTLLLTPGEYQYRIRMDGEWRDHAEAQRRVPNPFGSQNCVLTVS